MINYFVSLQWKQQTTFASDTSLYIEKGEQNISIPFIRSPQYTCRRAVVIETSSFRPYSSGFRIRWWTQGAGQLLHSSFLTIFE